MSNEINKKLATSIGSSVRRVRKTLELTQQDVAEQVDVSVEFYARIERGHALPSIRTFDRMVTALGVSADTLLGRSDAEADNIVLRPRPLPAPESPEVQRLARWLRTAHPSTIRFVTRLVIEVERMRASRGGDEPATNSHAPAQPEPPGRESRASNRSDEER